MTNITKISLVSLLNLVLMPQRGFFGGLLADLGNVYYLGGYL